MGAPALPIRHSSLVDRGVLWPLLLLLRRPSFFDVAGGAPPGPDPPSTHCRPGRVRPDQRRYRCAAGPDLLCAEERAAGDGTHREVAEPHRGVSDRSGRCRRYRPGFPVLGAGTSGSLVAIATGSPVAVGSGMVNTANALHDLPVVKDAWAAGSISGLHVYQILAHAPPSMTSPANRPRSSAWPS